MSDVYVLGVDMIKFGRFPDRTVPNIGAEAALMALDDAGLTIKDMQAMYCGNLGQANAMVGQRILQEIGQTGIPVVNCANACATGATAFREAWMSIKAGIYDVVLAVGVEKMGKGLLGGAGGGRWYSKRRSTRLRNYALCFCRSRNGTFKRSWNNLRTICEDFCKKSSSFDNESQSNVSN